MEEAAPQRLYPLREVRYLARGGTPWRMIPHDLPHWQVVYQQTQRWIRAQVFEAMVHDLWEVLRLREGRKAQPPAVILDSRTVQSTPESGARSGYDGSKRRRGDSKRSSSEKPRSPSNSADNSASNGGPLSFLGRMVARQAADAWSPDITRMMCWFGLTGIGAPMPRAACNPQQRIPDRDKQGQNTPVQV